MPAPPDCEFWLPWPPTRTRTPRATTTTAAATIQGIHEVFSEVCWEERKPESLPRSWLSFGLGFRLGSLLRSSAGINEIVPALAEAGPLNGLAEVVAAHFDFNALLRQTGAHALADTIAKRLFTHYVAGCGRSLLGQRRRCVGIIGRDQGGPLVVVACIQNQGYGVPHPIGRLLRSQLIQDEHFGLEDGGQDLQLCGGDEGVIGFLNTLEQLAVVAEKPADPFLEDQGVEDADGKVCLTDAYVAGEEKPTAVGGNGISADEIARHHIGRRQGLIGLAVAGFIAVEGAMLVSSGDGSPFEQPGGLPLQAAFARLGVAFPIRLNS